LRIYAALQAAGVPFEARIVGEGEMLAQLERMAGELGVAAHVSFLGHLSPLDVWSQLAWADVLLHTGVVAPSGDRDGLPNVIPEAMAAGALVVTSPAAASTEAIHAATTGLVASVETPAEWVAALRRLMVDDVLCERLRRAARCWVEENFDAHKNAARLHELFAQAIAGKAARSPLPASAMGGTSLPSLPAVAGGVGVPPVSSIASDAKSLTTPQTKS
jgi:glycosyltransferase involved in cell wall biosynthesis